MYVNAVAGDGFNGGNGSDGNHGPFEFVLYCKIYPVMTVPPLSDGAAQLTTLI